MKNPSPKELFQLLDLTTLNATDSKKDVKALVDFALEQSQRGFSAAAVCVHSYFADFLSKLLSDSDIGAAVVAGAFPHGQASIDVKTLEVEDAALDGVDEVDIVINRGLLLSGDLHGLKQELTEMREAADSLCLKTIIESGELKTPELITKASQLSLLCGADFIKTSTGKSEIGATPEAVRIMCKVIREFYEQQGEKRGIKVSGGVKTYDDALVYYNIVEEILGEAWLTPNLFRFGASSLAHELLNK